jgi:hypothetical protein
MSLNIASDFNLSIEQVLGESIAVLGIKGSGKSNTAAVLAEELLDAGLPLVIVDIAGEYWGLKERFQILVAGRSPQSEVPLEVSGAAQLAEFSLTNSIPVILDLSEHKQDERFEIVSAYFERLWDKAGQLRRPYQIIIEEAHNFIPQSGSTPATEIAVRIATEGRKRGLGIVMIGQRSARIDKNVLSQAGILFLHKVRHPADVSVYQDIIPSDRAWVKSTTNGLETGESIALVGDEPEVVMVRKRHTFHAGYTPGMGDVKPPDLRGLDKKTLSELKKLMTVKPVIDQEKEALKVQIDDLGQQLEALQAVVTEKDVAIGDLEEKIRKQEIMLETVGLIRVEVEQVQNNGGAVVTQAPQIVRVKEPELSRVDHEASKRQQRRFDTLLADVQSLPKQHRSILTYLIERPDELLTTAQLARRLGYSESTLIKAPPVRLIEMKLITRNGRAGKYQYKANARTILSEMFPALDIDTLITQLSSK